MKRGELRGHAQQRKGSASGQANRLAAALFALFALAFAAAPASAIASPGSENSAATHAYLVASNTFEEAELRNLPQSNAATEATGAQISRECPGVLAGAPSGEQEVSFTSFQAQTPVSPRAEGERHRQATQSEDIKFELSVALEYAQSQPNREASEALIGSLTPLRWSNLTLTALVHVTLATVKAELELPVPNVCADMSAWVASGYKTLSPVSKAIAAHVEALVKDAFELIAIVAHYHLKSFPEVLEPDENASDRALARHVQTLTAELHSSSVTKEKTLKDMEATVGLPAPKPQKKLLPSIKKPPVVARGRTAAGGKFVVRAEGRAGRPDTVGCSVFVTIEEPSRPQEGLIELLSSGGGTSRCLSGSHVNPQPAVQCNSGLLTVEASLLPATRSVRLLLSDQRTVISPAIHVPTRTGGPAGLYYQVVRGPSPIPVSLSELDAQGNTLTVLKLPAVVECAKNPIKYGHDGVVQIVHESPPQIPPFTIRAERYSKLGTSYFKLNLELDNEGLFGAGVASSIEQAVEQGLAQHARRVLFAPQASGGCQPQPYAIIYGLLKAPQDTVLALVSGKLVPLRTAAIPAHLHAGGVLAYGAFSPLPTELVIRNAHGNTLATESLSAAAKDATETCEGEAES